MSFYMYIDQIHLSYFKVVNQYKVWEKWQDILNLQQVVSL
jgi:hypothetical protein